MAGRNGSGVMSISYPDFTSGSVINSTHVDTNNAEITTEITNSIPRDGQAAPTANIPFGGYKITGLGDGSAATDSANLGQIQAQAYIWCGTAGGTKNALTLTPSPPISAYAAGQTFVFKSGSTASDDAVTVAISGLTTKAIQNSGAALSSTVTIEANNYYKIYNDGTAFQISKLGLVVGDLANLDTVDTGQIEDAAVTYAKLDSSVYEYLAPTGAIIPYAGLTEPSGWLFCYGQAISRTTYSSLFSAISTTYGSGDGSTTFNVPDLRGRVVAGQDDMGGTSANRLTGVTGSVNGDTLGGTGGEEAHALSIAELAAHTHFGFAAIVATQPAGSVVDLTNSTQVAATGVSSSDSRNYTLTSTATAATVGLTSSTGSGTAHNTVQPTIILNYIIKY